MALESKCTLFVFRCSFGLTESPRAAFALLVLSLPEASGWVVRVLVLVSSWLSWVSSSVFSL
ncbi:hypothetical protein E2C01_053244 [Portunus trituberculatus]|uniref:Uncharacterized protein n=1 Tax=Portunus trituberculatus TaxID=210409 RepID=A0A5B7GQ95_PORTR|nr:hypothetical protein [Portunus trituberculatus]